MGVRWGTFSVYGVKLHMLCATNRTPISYELPTANTAEVHLSKELLEEAELREEIARKLLADLAYRSEDLEEKLAELGIMSVSSEASGRRPGVRQQIEICFSSLKRTFGLGETLATTLVRLATRIAAYTYFLHQPDDESSSRSDQRTVGINLVTHLVSRPSATAKLDTRRCAPTRAMRG